MGKNFLTGGSFGGSLLPPAKAVLLKNMTIRQACINFFIVFSPDGYPMMLLVWDISHKMSVCRFIASGAIFTLSV